MNFWGSVYPTYYAMPHLKASKGKLIMSSSTAAMAPTSRMNFTTGGALFAEGPGHSAKAQKPSAKALPSAALGKEPSEKYLTAKRLFAEGHLSGTWQSLFRVPSATLGKEKQPSTALLR